jgi:putative pyruvate formate lyase activating enzyme
VCRSPLNAVVARAGLHFWEEPVISGERGSGTVFFSGCNLHCVYCQNHNISMGRQGREVSVARLREIYRELTEQGAHNINLVTPSHFTGAVLASLAEPPEIPVVYNTNGYDLPETLKLYRGKVDIYLPDLKYADNAAAMRYSKVPDYFERTAAAIAEMYAQTGDFRINDDGIMERGVIIRHLILPGQVENTLRVIDYVAKNFRPGQVMFSLMRQYLPCGKVSAGNYPELNRLVSNEEYARCEAALFDSGIEDGFVQDAESAGKEFIPAFDGTGV